MTDHQVQLLEAIGVQWRLRPKQVPWETRFQEWKTFHAMHGHWNVSKTENKKLANWVQNQRSAYKWKKEGKHSWLTDDRMQLLQSIGFDGKSCQRGPKRGSIVSEFEKENYNDSHHVQEGESDCQDDSALDRKQNCALDIPPAKRHKLAHKKYVKELTEKVHAALRRNPLDPKSLDAMMRRPYDSHPLLAL